MHLEILQSDPTTLEYISEDFFPKGLFCPVRPTWQKHMSKAVFEGRENKMVRVYAEKIEKDFANTEINLFEQNQETWKQLWRVIDKSDVLLFIVDARFAVS